MPSRSREMQHSPTNPENFVGIGITIKFVTYLLLMYHKLLRFYRRKEKRTGSFTVGRVFQNGPAYSLIFPGDELESINKISLGGMRTRDVAALILGQ